VFASLVLILRNPAAAEDAAQEGYLRAFRAWKNWKQEAPAEAWLYRIALNVAFTHRRREQLFQISEVIRRLGRPKDPDPTFNGDSSAHWEGDTLVVDVIALDDRLRNVAVGGFSGEGNAWLHSPMEHIVERWSRPSKNYLTYQITIEDPMILTKPWTSAPRKWSLVADPKEEWGEVFCTHNEEPDEWKHIDSGVKDDYENKYKK